MESPTVKAIKTAVCSRLTLLHTVVASLALAVCSASASAAPKVYVVTAGQQFGTVDLFSGHFQAISDTADALTNLVWWHGSLLSAAYFGPDTGNIVRIDPATGAVSPIGPTGLGANLFEFAGIRDHLYVTDFNGNLYSVNPETGAATIQGPTVPADQFVPFSANNDGSINLCEEAMYGIGEALYATFDEWALDPSGPFPLSPTAPLTSAVHPTAREHAWIRPRIYRIDPVTGATTMVARRTNWQILSMVEVDGWVYAFESAVTGLDSSVGLPTGQTELVLLNLENGQTRKIADVDSGPFGGVFGAAPVRPDDR
jgi:hypothetical protein